MSAKKIDSPYRVGTGFDIHRLVAKRACVLGGVKIPFNKGPLGHSDGDALLHAIADALLGAAGLDDLGSLFSDKDAKYKDASSGKLMKEVVRKVHSAGFQIINVDAIVVTEEPKIGPHRTKIRASIAKLLDISADRVNVRGKTAEGLGAIGKGKALSSTAVALLYRSALST